MKEKDEKRKRDRKKGDHFGRTIINDFKQGNLKRTLRQDLNDIYWFYLDKETRSRLSEMKRIKRYLYMIFWLTKSLFLKLTPLRRILLLFAFWMFFLFNMTLGNESYEVMISSKFFGFVILLLVLALELKDKLLAHDELAVGRTVQMALMPQDNPKMNGWDIWLFTKPANDVGGDLVDYIRLDENRLSLVIGDIAGKGLGAALFMSKLQASVRAIAPTAKSFSDLGAKLNEIFYRDGLPNRFASMLYLELGTGRKIDFLNAGHNPPICISNGLADELPPGAPALGLMADVKYQSQSVTLKTNDILLIYSDGLTEARNTRGEFFGMERLQDVLTKNSKLNTETLGNKLIQETTAFIGDARPHDDLSVILLKRI